MTTSLLRGIRLFRYRSKDGFNASENAKEEKIEKLTQLEHSVLGRRIYFSHVRKTADEKLFFHLTVPRKAPHPPRLSQVLDLRQSNRRPDGRFESLPPGHSSRSAGFIVRNIRLLTRVGDFAVGETVKKKAPSRMAREQHASNTINLS